MSKRINLNSNEYEVLYTDSLGVCYIQRENALNHMEGDARYEVYTLSTDSNSEERYVKKKFGTTVAYIQQKYVKVADNKEARINRSSSPANATKKEIESLRKQNEELMNQVTTLLRDNDALERMLSDYNLMLEAQKIADYNSMLDEAKEKNKQGPAKHQEVKNFKTQRDLKYKNKELNKIINENKEVIEKTIKYYENVLKYTREEAERRKNGSEARIKKYKETQKQLESALVSLKLELDKERKSVDEQGAEIKRLQGVIVKEKNPKIEKLEQNIKRVKTAREQLEGQLNEVLAEKTFLEGRIAQLEEKADEDAKTISKLKERLKNAAPILKKALIAAIAIGLFSTGLGIARNYEKLLKINKTESEKAAIVEEQTNQVRATLKPLLEEKFGTILDYNDNDTKGYLSVYARKDNVVSVYKIVMPFENLEDYNIKKSLLKEFTEYVKEGQFEAEASFDTEKTNDILLGGKYYNLNGSKADAGLFASDYDNFAATDIQKEVVKDDKGNVLYVVASIDVYQFNDDATNDGVVTRFSKNLSEEEFDCMSAEEVYATLLKTGSRDDLGSCFNFGGELNVEEALNQIKSGIEMTEAEKKDLQKYLSANVKHFTNNTIQDVVVDTGSVKYITVKNASGKEYLYAIPVTQDGKVDSAREVEVYTHIDDLVSGHQEAKETLYFKLVGENYSNPYSEEVPVYVKAESGKVDGSYFGKADTIAVNYKNGELPTVIENKNVLFAENNTGVTIKQLTKALINLLNGAPSGFVDHDLVLTQGAEIASASTSDAEASK